MSRGIEFAKRGDFLTSNGNNGFDIDSYGTFKKKVSGRDTSTRITNNDGSRAYSRSAVYDPDAWTTDSEFANTRREHQAERRNGINYKIPDNAETMRNTNYNKSIPSGEFDCLQFIKDCLGIRGGRRGGGDGDSVTLEDIRNFLDSHSDIKDMLMKQECPLNPSETMKSDVKELMDMMEKYGPVTMNELYPKGGRKRRSRRTKRRKGKSRRRYSKRRYLV
jgi:hypothetical protein